MTTPDQAGRARSAAARADRGSTARSQVARWMLRVGTSAALAVDAYVHAWNASAYDSVTATVTEGQLFRAEAGLAIAAGLLVLVRPRRTGWVVAVLVAASALGAVLIYRYIDIGPIGPFPDMYENTWQVPGKLLSAYAEGAAVVLAGLGLLVHQTVASPVLGFRAVREPSA